MGHLINERFEKKFESYPIRSQQKKIDPTVIAKLYDNRSEAIWFLLEYDKESKIALAYVVGICLAEPGSISVDWLEKIIDPIQGDPRVHQDFNFVQKSLKEALSEVLPVHPLLSN
jgi:hypothetical protein